jgi:hypothetical protein
MDDGAALAMRLSLEQMRAHLETLAAEVDATRRDAWFQRTLEEG